MAGPIIGGLNEGPLHRAIKEWYARPGDAMEVALDGYVIDLVRGEELVEVQTGGFSGLGTKLDRLLANHPVRLVFPIAQELWICKVGGGGEILSRRKSPKRGRVADLFAALVSLPTLMHHPNFTLDALLIQEDQIRVNDGSRGWRRKGWVIHERRLRRVMAQHTFTSAPDLLALLPPNLPTPFTTADLAGQAAMPRRLAQRMVYCLREMGTLVVVGKRGNGWLYDSVRRREEIGQ